MCDELVTGKAPGAVTVTISAGIAHDRPAGVSGLVNSMAIVVATGNVWCTANR